MKIKIILSLFVMVFLIGLVFSAGEIISKTVDIGNLIGGGLDITANGVELIKKENENVLISFLEGGSANINGSLFMNVEKLSSIELDNTGKITFADLTASEDAIFTFGDKNYKVLKGNRIEYNNGNLTFYGNVGDTFGFADKSSNLFKDFKLNGESVKLNLDNDGNSILEGDFKIGNDEFKGLGEGKSGKATISKSTGKISEVWKGTDATINGINNKVSGGNLKIYYEDVFNPPSSGNYINYGKNSISLGGIGFTADFGEKNGVFGDMNIKKIVDGIGTKTRDFEVTMDGGNLKIDKINTDLFNVNGNGEYIINNGRVVIYSQKEFIIEDGKRVLADKESIFVRTNYGGGLSSSYNLNLNEGEYNLENNIFKNKNGNTLFNANTGWENTVIVARDTTLTEAGKIRSKLQNEGRKIYTDDPNFLTWIKSPTGEAIMKEIYTATDSANQNIYGVKISPIEVYTAMKSEAAGFTDGGKRNPLFGKYSENPDWNMLGMEFGLSNCGSSQDIKRLKEGSFISNNLNVKEYKVGSFLTPGLTAKDGFEYFAGIWAQKKYFFRKDFVDMYGEEELNKLTFDEEYYWTTAYFNVGEGAGKEKLKDRKNNYIGMWTGPTPEDNYNWKFNARQRTDFTYLLKALKLFEHL